LGGFEIGKCEVIKYQIKTYEDTSRNNEIIETFMNASEG